MGNDPNSLPLVTIVMPCYNAEATIAFAIDSVLGQSYSNWELIVINDGSTDNSVEVVDRYLDPRVRLVSLSTNMGRGVARQKGLEEAEGDFLAMLDADDWISSDKLEKQVTFLMDHPGIAVVSSAMGITDDVDDLVGVRGPLALVIKECVTVELIPLPHGPAMIWMDIAKKAAYNPKLKLSQDSHFLLQCVLNRKYAVMPDMFYFYSEMVSVTKSKIVRSYYYTALFLSSFFRVAPFKVIYLICRQALKFFYFLLVRSWRPISHTLSVRSRPPSESDMKRYRFENQRLRK